MLKARFPILKMMPNYPLRRQRRIHVACCVLHNSIRREARRDKLFDEFQVEDLELIDEEGLGVNQRDGNKLDTSINYLYDMCSP